MQLRRLLFQALYPDTSDYNRSYTRIGQLIMLLERVLRKMFLLLGHACNLQTKPTDAYVYTFRPVIRNKFLNYKL